MRNKLVLALINSRRAGSGIRNATHPPLNNLNEIDHSSIQWAFKNIDDLNKAVVNEHMQTPTVRIGYTNYRGEYTIRRIKPIAIWHGSTEYHPKPQWLMNAYDVEKQACRDFAMKDIEKFYDELK